MDTRSLHTHSDAHRLGSAGMHDLVNLENINRTMKKNEVLRPYQSIYLTPPPDYRRGSYKMLLVQGPHDERAGTALFPLGLGYIAAILTQIGVIVEVLDAHAEQLTPDQTLDSLKSRDFDLVGITALSTQYGFVKWLSQEIKTLRPSARIVLGGQLAHYNPHTVIENTAVDVCVIGEGEVTIQDLIFNLPDCSRVAGIAYRDETGRYRRNPDRPRISNPDAIPLPHYDVFNMDHYFNTSGFGMRAKRSINVLASRGCPYSCTFCSLSFPNITYRSVENVIAEIQYLKKRYGVDGIMFCDELFVVDKKRVYEFCEKLKPLKVSWGGQGRANIVNDDEKLLQAMKDAGAGYIGFGLESATSEILSKMQKKTTVEQNINAVRTAQKVGLAVVAQYMFGFPGETLETVKASVEFFKKVNYIPPVGEKAACHISLTVPLPGSQLYEDCKTSGFISDEDAFLQKISVGYYHNKDVVINLTDFTDDELIDLKRAAEQTIVENYMEWRRAQSPLNRGWLYTVKQAALIPYDVYRFEGLRSLALKLAARIMRRLRGDRRAFAVHPPKTDYVWRSPRAKNFREAMKGVTAECAR